MPITLRPALPTDIPALNPLIERSARLLSQGYYSPRQIDAAIRHVFGVDSRLVEDGTYLVAEEGDAIVGCGGWSRRKTMYGGDQRPVGPPEYLDPKVDAARIRAFFVAPEAARRGIGRQLLEACAAAAGRAGFTRLALMATLPGVPLYAACGFVEVEPVTDLLPDGTAIEFVRMERPLNRPPASDRRHAVPFDPEYFAARAAQGETLPPVEAFRHAWRSNLWGGAESRSGPGSGMDQTATLRLALPRLFQQLGIGSILDVPCGDWRWMASVDLGPVHYAGGDLLEELVEQNQRTHGGPRRRFLQLDLTRSPLPPADLLLCRDCLVHLSFADIRQALDNVGRSGITYLLTTTFPGQSVNAEIVTGDWRPINLEAAPFGLPAPLELVNEGCTEGEGRFADKSLGLWRIRDLARAPHI